MTAYKIPGGVAINCKNPYPYFISHDNLPSLGCYEISFLNTNLLIYNFTLKIQRLLQRSGINGLIYLI